MRRMMDAYATWNPKAATMEADGRPDTLMVPLVEALREAGFTTYQSCQGHAGYSDGHLWIKEGPHRDRFPSSASFQRIQHVYLGPEGDYWEYWWSPHQTVTAVWEIARTYGVWSDERDGE